MIIYNLCHMLYNERSGDYVVNVRGIFWRVESYLPERSAFIRPPKIGHLQRTVLWSQFLSAQLYLSIWNGEVSSIEKVLRMRGVCG